jgi:thiazole synthase
MGRGPTQGDKKRLLFSNYSPPEAPPFPLSSRPERSAVERSLCGCTLLEMFSTEESVQNDCLSPSDGQFLWPPLQAYNIAMEPLVIAGKAFQSRLIVGTGKYKDGAETQAAIEASGAEMVTVAVRRINLDRSRESLLDYIDPERYFLLPNTAGCYTADEAIRAARLGREVGISDWVKIEVIGDQATLYPDVQATLEATRVLVKEGFTVLPYTSDDIVFARRLIDAGAAAVMPLGAPIGSGMGLQNLATLRILREMITEVPLIVDAGVGMASDVCLAMDMGADAVLINSAIAHAAKPVLMAEAMQHAVLAGRQSFLSGRMPRKLYATASSPLEGLSK